VQFHKKMQEYFFFIVLSLSVVLILVSLLLVPDEKEAFIVLNATSQSALHQKRHGNKPQVKMLSYSLHAMPSKGLYLNMQLMGGVVLLYLQQLGSIDLPFAQQQRAPRGLLEQGSNSVSRALH